MEWTLSTLLFSVIFGGRTPAAICYDDYTPAYRAARDAKRPLLVVLNPGEGSNQPRVRIEDIRKARLRRKLLKDYVVVDVDTSSPCGKVVLGLFKPATLPHVVVIDKDQKYQLYQSAKPLLLEDWNLLLEQFQKGDLSTLSLADGFAGCRPDAPGGRGEILSRPRCEPNN